MDPFETHAIEKSGPLSATPRGEARVAIADCRLVECCSRRCSFAYSECVTMGLQSREAVMSC
jgi:hypothetical protein